MISQKPSKAQQFIAKWIGVAASVEASINAAKAQEMAVRKQWEQREKAAFEQWKVRRENEQ